MMTATPNDVWLRHILGQTSHHCGTKWSNIILSEAKNIISPQAMHHLTYMRFYEDIIKQNEDTRYRMMSCATRGNYIQQALPVDYNDH